MPTRDSRSASFEPVQLSQQDATRQRRRLGTDSGLSPHQTEADESLPHSHGPKRHVPPSHAHSVPNLHVTTMSPTSGIRKRSVQSTPLASAAMASTAAAVVAASSSTNAMNQPLAWPSDDRLHDQPLPSTMKLLSELERSWAMFSARWKVVEVFAGMQIWQEQMNDTEMEPPNGLLIAIMTTSLIAFLAGTIGGTGVVLAAMLAGIVGIGVFWSRSSARVKRRVPCFKSSRVIDGAPYDVFLSLMNVDNYAMWDASVEKATVVHTIDSHSDIIHIVYRPVWMWPLWFQPRDLCLLRYWRCTTDGSYVICLQSTVHPECPATHDIIRARCDGGGFIVAPRSQGNAHIDEFSSLVTHVLHMNPQGWEGALLQRFDAMLAYLRPHIMALAGLQEMMDARKYVCPNLPDELSSAMASVEGVSRAMSFTDGDVTGERSSHGNQPLHEFECTVPRSMWTEPDGTAMLVRGPDYLTDRRKIPSAPPVFRLVGVDLFECKEPQEHIAARPDNIVQRELARHAQAGTEMPFTFVINFVIPGNPRLALVLYYQAPSPSVLTEDSPFADLMNEFLEGTDEFRNERFKLIPCIVEGSFIVRQAVGSTPAIIGKKLRQPYYRGKNYFELDVDISSSAVANRVVGLVSGYTKKLVIDMGFLLEGQRQDELPERLFGSCRLVHLDLSVAKPLD